MKDPSVISDIKKVVATKNVQNKAKQILSKNEHKTMDKVQQDTAKGMKASTKINFSKRMPRHFTAN